MLKRIGLILLWLLGLLLVLASSNINDPYMIVLRGPGAIVLMLDV